MAVPKRKKTPTVKPTVKGELKGKGPKAEPYSNPEGKFTVPKNLKSDKVKLRGGTNDSGPLDPVPDRELFASQKTLPDAIANKLRKTADPASVKSAMEALESAAISHEKEPSQGTGIYRQAWRSLGPSQQDEAIRILGSMDKRTGKELTPSAQKALVKREALIRRAFESPDPVPDSDLYTSVPKNNTPADRELALYRDGKAPSDAVDALTPKKRNLLAAANYHSSVLEEEWARVHAMFPENEEGRQLSLSGPFRNAKDQLNKIIKAHPELEPLISTENIEDQIMPPDPEEPDTSRVRYQGTKADSSYYLGTKGARAGYVEERPDTRRKMRENPAWRSILQMQKMEDLPGKPEPKLLPVIATKTKGVQKTPTIYSDVQGIDKSLGYITADSEAGTPAQTKFARSRAFADERSEAEKSLEQLQKLLGGNTQDLDSMSVSDPSKVSPNVDTLSGSSNTDNPKQIVNRSKQANTQERQRDINLDLAVPQWRALVHQLSEDGTSIEWGRLTPEQIAGIYLGNLNSGTVAPENVASAIRQLVPAIKRAMENAPATLANEAGDRYEQAQSFENKRLPSNRRVSRLVKQSQVMNGPEFSPSVDLEGADSTPSFESGDRIPEDGENIEVPSMVQEAPAAPAVARVIDTSPTYWDKAFERGTISPEHYAVIKADQDANPRYIETPVQEEVRKKRPAPVEEEFIPRDAGQQMLDNPDLPMQSGEDTQRQLARILGERPSTGAPQAAEISEVRPFRGVDERPALSWDTVEEPNIMPDSEVAEGVRIPEEGEQSFIDTGLANPTNDQRTLQTLLAIRDAAQDERITTPTMQPPGRTRRVAEEADFPNPMSEEEPLTAEQWYSGPRAGGQGSGPFMQAKAARKQVQGEVILQKGEPTAESDPKAFMDNLRDSILRPLEIQNNIDATAAIVKKPEIQQSPMNTGSGFFTRQSDSGVKELVPQANPTQSAIERILQSLLEQQQRP